MLRSCGFAVCMWLFLADVAGQPNAPTQLSALPRYSTPVEIVVLWQDNSNDEDGFRIERREEGTAAWTFWTTVPAGAGAGQREWIDNAADENTYWEYRVCATSAALGNSAFTTPSYPMIRKQLWPVHDGDHDILHSFGTPLDFN
ncbi:MAG: hypothetical protein J5I94_27070, partial [Phaeodactylibacter sp.]|nr:hypothetical protein [Phaeodactylibacter sp.]